MPPVHSSKKLHPGSSTGKTSLIVSNARASAKCRPWNVVHACEWAREVLPLVEGQLTVGMRPSLLTPGGYGFAGNLIENRGKEGNQLSLLQMWNHVREWRR